MYYPEVIDNPNSMQMISQWRGYNHNYRIEMGEFHDMENMVLDGFPIMMARDVRPTLLNAIHAYRAILYTDSSLAWLDGNVFHFRSWMIDLEDLVTGAATFVEWDEEFEDEPDEAEIEWTEQTMIRFGTYVLIYPMNIWVDINARTAGLMASRFVSEAGITITYTISTKDGDDYDNITASETAPENPDENDYWLNTTPGEEGLNVYLNNSWQPVPTCYLRIEIPGATLTDYFEVEDIVNMNSATVSDINNGSMIQAIDDDFIVVIGIMDEITKSEITSAGYKLTIERVLPVLDYVCADKNRVWGCRYGYDIYGNLINEIYASKLGDFKNWYSYQGLSTDSYAATIGIPGSFTGCISYGGYPTFFKENAIIRVSGNYPAEYYVMTMDARGVQEGSEKSLAIVGEALYYKAPGGVMVYDGSLPRMISNAFGRENYYDGVAGVCGDKYYLEVQNERGGHRMFVYDSNYGLWTKESDLDLIAFSGSLDGRLFAFTSDKVFGFGLSDNELYTNKQIGEEFVSWYLETGEMGFEIAEYKFVSKLTIRAYIPSTSEIEVKIAYDNRAFESLGTLRDFDDIQTHTLAFAPYRCDHFKIRLEGHGSVRLYSMAITVNSESDEYEYNN